MYFDAPYPDSVATFGSAIGISGTGPFVGSQTCAALIDEVKISFAELLAPAQKSSSLRVPEIWFSKEPRA